MEQKLILSKNNNGYANFFTQISSLNQKELDKMLEELIYGFKSKEYISTTKDICKTIKKENLCYREIKESKIKELYNYIYKEGFNNVVKPSHDQIFNLNYIKKIINNIYKNNNLSIDLNNFKNNYFSSYSICHIYDATKNPYLYTMPWNYFLIPTPIAPLTDSSNAYKASHLLNNIKKQICHDYWQEILIYDYTIKKIFNKLKKKTEFNNMINNLDKNDLVNIRNQFYTINPFTKKIKPLI